MLSGLNSHKTNTVLQTLNLKGNESLSLLSDWEKKISSPDLNEFRWDLPENEGMNLQKSDATYNKILNEDKDDKSGLPSKLFTTVSVGDLKRRLLKENGKLKDRFMSTASLFSNRGQSNIGATEADSRNVLEVGKVNIQEWIKNQQKEDKLPFEKKDTMKDIFNVDPSGMIYMASVAAAAATSAGLTSVQQRVSFKEDQFGKSKGVNSTNKSKLKTIRSRRKELAREDLKSAWISDVSTTNKTGLAGLISDDDQLSSSATKVGDQFLLNQQGLKSREKSKMKNILSKIQYENNQMAHMLSSYQDL